MVSFQSSLNGYGAIQRGSIAVFAVVATVISATGIALAQPQSADSAKAALYAWGNNDFGQIGDGSTTARTSAVLIALPGGVPPLSVASEGDTSLALGTDGTVFSWGDNQQGQLGVGSTTNSPTPVRVPLPHNRKAVAIAGDYAVVGGGGVLEHADTSMAIGVDGHLYVWGDNEHGQFGDGTTTGSSVPVEVTLPGGTAAVAIAGGRDTSYALARNNTLYAWGLNDLGSIGDGTRMIDKHVPTPVTFPVGVHATSVTAGSGTGMAIGSDNKLYAWGNNNYGQLGDGSTDDALVPHVVPTPAGIRFTSMSTGGDTSAAIGSDGGVYAWGYDEHGEVGNGGTAEVLAPVRVALPPGATASTVVVGSFAEYDGGCQLCGSGDVVHYGTVFVTTTDGRIFAWGVNDDGQFGNGTTTGSTTPVSVPKSGGQTPRVMSTNGGTVLAIVGGSTGQPPVFDVADPPLAVARGVQYNAIFAAESATSYGLTTAPSWLSVDAHGAVTGTPPAGTTTFTYRVSASNPAGTTTTAIFTVAVQATAQVRGDVVTPGSSPQRVVGAAVEACTTAEVCARTTTDGNGAFTLAVPIGATFHVTAYPPGSSSGLVTTSSGALHQTSAGTTGLEIALGGISPLDDGLRLNGSLNPVLFWGSPTTATQAGCKNGIGFVTVDGENASTGQYDVLTYPLVETPQGSGNYAGMIPPLAPVHGAVDVQSSISCPEASALTPNSGPSTGGTKVVIAGSSFAHTTAVSFGETPAKSFTVESDDSIIAVAPAGAGTVPITVTVGGRSTLADRYTYEAVTSISPTHGPASGGTTVTITGSGIAGATGVLFGTVPASFTQISPSVIRATAPPGAGTVDITVGTAGLARTPVSDVDKFDYSAIAQRFSTAPASPTLPRSSFANAQFQQVFHALTEHPEVLSEAFGSIQSLVAAAQTVLDPTCDNLDSVKGNIAALYFAPQIGEIAAGSSFAAEALLVALGLSPVGIAVSVLAGLTFVAVDFILSNYAGNFAAGLFASQRSQEDNARCAKANTRVDPSGTVVDTNGAPISDATTTILRSDSAAGPFRAVPAGSPDIEPSTNPETTIADGAFHWDVISGFYEIRASAPHCTDPNDRSSSAAVTIGPYAVPPPRVGLVITLACAHESPPSAPTVAQLSSATGPTAGGTSVDITGAGFTPASTVTFGTTPARSVTYLSPQALRVVSPAGTGTRDVFAANAGHRSASTPADRFVFADPPTISGVTPASGPAGGGTPVTVTGTGFTGATAVLFGASAATSFTVESDTTITAVSPAGSAGAVDIAVVTPTGATSPVDADTFTYTLGSAAGAFVGVGPARVLDTRSGLGGSGPVAASGVVHLQVTGRGGVPSSGVSAVVLNVTVTGASGSGYVTVYPGGVARPVVSNLNFVAGQTVPNLVVVPVGADGSVDLFDGSGGSVQLIADVAGYYLAGTPSVPGAFAGVGPARVLDTRSGLGGSGPVAASGVVHLQVTGRGGVPSSGVSAVVLNVTVTGASGSGYVTVYPGGVARPVVSNLNFVAGQTVPNLVVVPVGADGSVDLFDGSGGSVQLIADVAGYYLAGTPSVPGAFAGVGPARVLDTRSGLGGSGPVAASGVVHLQVTGRGGVPSSGVSAVVLNVTVTGASGSGYVTVYPGGVARPVVSNLNFVAGQTVPNLVVVPVGADGSVDLFDGSGGSVQLIADVAGYYLA